MTATTTLLVVAVVGGFGVLDGVQVSQIYDDTFSQRIAQYDEALRVKGESTVDVFAQASQVALIQNSWGDVRALVGKTVAQDPDLAVIYVLDRNRNLVAHSGQKNYGDELAPVSDPSWPVLLDQWKRGETGTRGLARVEREAAPGRRVRFFAVPVPLGSSPATAQMAARPDPGDDRLGYVVLGYSLEPIARFARENSAAKEAAQRRSLDRTLLIGALFVLAGSLLAVLQSFRVARPIRALTTKVSQIAQGDLDSRVEVTSTDEVGVLAENFNYMADQLVVLLSAAAEKAAMQKELEVTRVVQERLLPTQSEIRVGTISLAAYYEPASQCGGDWWTCHELGDGRSLILIGDVTGHGVPAAMVTATAKSACDVARATSSRNLELQRLLSIMNYAILESAKREFQMTCFASIYDSATGVLQCANAGHNPPLRFRPQATGTARCRTLLGTGTRLGDLASPHFPPFQESLEPGDIVVWYTDGILDCVNAAGVEFGSKRLVACLERVGDGTAVEIRDRILHEALAFYGNTPRRDDMTVVVGKVDRA